MDLAICPRKFLHGTKRYQRQHGAWSSRSHSRDAQEITAKAGTPTPRGRAGGRRGPDEFGGGLSRPSPGPGDESLSITQEPGSGAVSREPQPWLPTQCDRGMVT